MKTLRYRIGDLVKPGILDSDMNIRDVSDLVTDWDNENITIEKLNELKNVDFTSLPILYLKVFIIKSTLHQLSLMFQ